MTTWTADELDLIGRAQELELASARPDGSLRPFVTMWMVCVDDDLYVRSAHGASNPWFRRAVASGRGRLRASGVERDVTFGDSGRAPHDRIDAEYHTKYDRYGPGPVGSVTGPEAPAVTIRLIPEVRP